MTIDSWWKSAPTLALLLACGSARAMAMANSCETLKTLSIPHTTVTSAESIPAGGLNMPDMAIVKRLPALCRVAAVSRPTSDSEIKIEVWMPASNWNGKYRGTGNGGFAGSINFGAMAFDVAGGYATAGTDTGHQSGGVDARWALHHPEKINDFGYRGIHEMTVTAKVLVAAFYGDAPKHSYFFGCSDGGREALMEAQRFPEDYDGIVAGAPANYWTHLLVEGMTNVSAMEAPGAYIPASKIPAINAATLAACDALDGVKDGVLNDPRNCRFDPAVLLCHAADSDACLTAPQVKALRQIYAGPHNSRGDALFPGYVPGGEQGEGGWESWVTGRAPNTGALYGFGINFFRYMVFDDPAWSGSSFNVDRAVERADQKTGQALNAISTDLHAFTQRGGKLILYHGWSDPAIAPLNTISYFNQVSAAMGKQELDHSIRLYLAPGMQHCAGGPGPNSFGQFGPPAIKDKDHDINLAVEQWTETGIAPRSIIATNGRISRPLCPYPQSAKYKGTGDTNDASNFACTDESKR